jgi:hypothetical protein
MCIQLHVAVYLYKIYVLFNKFSTGYYVCMHIIYVVLIGMHNCWYWHASACIRVVHIYLYVTPL